MSDSLDNDWLLDIWKRRRPSLLTRVACVVDAASMPMPDELTTQAARSASRVLAGTIGVFDVPTARALAIELDGQICTGALAHAVGRARVYRLAVYLRQAIEAGE